jgi:xylulokinase
MSLLGIDVGTTGCKSSVFSVDGALLASAYREYDALHPQPGWAELDVQAVWGKIAETIAEVAAESKADPVTALSVSSLGEAFVPLGADGEILAPSMLNFDDRGAEYLDGLAAQVSDDRLYGINGNTLGNHYGLTKLLWLKEHQPKVYDAADSFLLWGAFVSVMLGADPVVDFSLANRTLLFDVEKEEWSEELLGLAGIDRGKLPAVAPSGTVIGCVSDGMAGKLGLPKGVAIVTGAHDQCANAVGGGVLSKGRALLGMGTFLCITPVYEGRRDPSMMAGLGLNTEHHAVPGKFVSFIYNQGGSLLKWYRDTFAAADHDAAREAGRDVYADLIGEIPDAPSSVTVLPHFTTTGPPEFIADSSGVIAGLRLETTRGDILKGVLEGAIFYLRECLESVSGADIDIAELCAVGGGSKSDAWLQISADILGRPLVRPKLTEAGALGAAILAGAATGAFSSLEEGVGAMVRMDRRFEPDAKRAAAYDGRFEQYRRLWPAMESFVRDPS